MPLKDQEKRKTYHTKYMKEVWYPKNKKKHISYVKRNKQRVTEFIEQYKRHQHCADCGFSGKDFPYVLDFDHKNNGLDKKFNIGSWSRTVLSVEAITREIAKCELVCANCHRKRTFLTKHRRKVRSPQIP
jgi:hypothetical protein